MRRRRPSYRRERSRSQRDGGIGIAMFLKQEREKKPPFAKSVARSIGRPLDKLLGTSRKPRKPRKH
jgi:hypothetical protein